ncbi:transcriptional regulator [Pseudomonas straminea]|uniref:Transcriptional regulator, contains XRE-family HTH domain n=1 Tax=Pseudomonas straminea TaxID=47882 RepID=A0A1I1WHE3_PSEOC|nr:helix-turn-helix transcriptional regulator [Pseudomonas straminea]GLX14765.1 transcriptional regulator [Pseudomonas straminea]SFD92843.1 Transcriptional regulator, contains XRE-family HTH domain [Pseudomonas straminea]
MLIASGVGERLREERERLGQNQTDFGQAAGVSRGTQKAYELGSSSPDIRYLSGLQALGVDVTYVLTGLREAAEVGDLSPDESHLLADYRRLSDAQRTHTSHMVNALAEMAGRYEVNGDK